jgi:predicted RNA-binding Zn-ribbon protein involved in translation (DUF1610 family)
MIIFFVLPKHISRIYIVKTHPGRDQFIPPTQNIPASDRITAQIPEESIQRGELIYCPLCGAEISSDAKFCRSWSNKFQI